MKLDSPSPPSSPAAPRASARRPRGRWPPRASRSRSSTATRTSGEKVAAEIGGIFCQVDVTSDEAVDAGFAKAREAHGQERICVNCAGVANAMKTVGRDKADRRDQALSDPPVRAGHPDQPDRHLPLLATSAAGMATLDPLEDGERGLIVNTASSPPRTARSARRPIPRPRPACSAWRCRSRAT